MYKRYQDVLDLVKLIDTTKGADNHIIVGDIIEYFHQNFADPTVMYANHESDTFHRLCDDVRQMLKYPSNPNFESMIYSIPPAFAALIFPIAVMRYILRDLNININPQKCHFKLFYEMYGELVLARPKSKT